MAWKYKSEIARKTFHLSAVLLIAAYFLVSYYSRHLWGVLSLAIILAIFALFEYTRLVLKKRIPIVSWFWQLKRQSERKKLGAEVYFILGALICFSLFDARIAAAAVLMATFGDLAAALVGKKLGKHWIKGLENRAWEGVIAELAVNLIAGFIVLRTSMWWLGAGFGQPLWPVIIAMAAAATIVETLTKRLPDNLVVPVFSGLAGQVILMLLAY
jgi:dolichol kinase